MDQEVVNDKEDFKSTKTNEFLDFVAVSISRGLDPREHGNCLNEIDLCQQHWKRHCLEYEKITRVLKAHLEEANSEKIQLSQNLGAAEYEISNLKIKLQETSKTTSDEIVCMKEKIDKTQSDAVISKEKYCRLKEQHSKLIDRLQKTEKYLADLPTASEYKKITEKMTNLQEENNNVKKKAEQLNCRLNENVKTIVEKEKTIDEMNVREAELAEELKQVQAELKSLKEEVSSNQEATPVDFSVLKRENVKLSNAVKRYKNLSEVSHQKQLQEREKYREDVGKLNNVIEQDEDTITGLKSEAASQLSEINNLKLAMKELAGQNQVLMGTNISLKERLTEYTNTYEGENAKAYKTLKRELEACILEAKCLVDFCKQISNGQEPDVSMLLGVKHIPTNETNAVCSVKDVEKVKALREDIEVVRTTLCDNYADYIASNTTCTTQ